MLQGAGVSRCKQKPEFLLLFRAKPSKGLFKKINNCVPPKRTLSPPSAQGVVFAGALGEPEVSVGISGVRLPTASGLRGGKPRCILPPNHEDLGMLVGDPHPLSAVPCPSNPEELPAAGRHKAAPRGTPHTPGTEKRERRRYF